MKYTFQDIAQALGHIHHEIKNSTGELNISNAFPFNSSNEETLTWVNDQYDDLLSIYNSVWGLVVLSKKAYDSFTSFGNTSFPMLVVDNPKWVFSILANRFLLKENQPFIHQSAFIAENAIVGNNVSIGAFSYIGNCSIGNNVVIYHNCTIYDDVVIGDNVVISSGCVIGGNGFSFLKNEQMMHDRFPAFGSVVLEDFVEIGANNCIDRGTSGDTILKKGAKTDNLVHIAHDVLVGENVLIIANATIAGHTKIGANSRISPSASLFQRLTIGENVTIGVGSVVSQNIPDNSVYTGNPAMEISKFVKLEREKRKLIKK
jgi:UDP-3-O-[3-hydroxymyristoyl] glucosamine N-acyltransferase